MNQNQVQVGMATAQNKGGALASSNMARETQEVQAMMYVAKSFPRDQMAALDKIIQACTRPKLANGALFSYARGKTDVTGPSIRLAEAIAQNWGNLQWGIREVEQRDGESTVEAFAWDMESNTRQVKVFQMPHVRYTRSGSYDLEDPRDIYELVANQGARRLRACILGIVPSDIVEEAILQCEETMKTTADTTPAAIAAMLTAFAAMGVTKDMIEKRIQRHVDAITPALKVHLGKVYTSLKDGMSQPSDWFESGNVAETPEVKAAVKSTADSIAKMKERQGVKDVEVAPAAKEKPAAKKEAAATAPVRANKDRAGWSQLILEASSVVARAGNPANRDALVAAIDAGDADLVRDAMLIAEEIIAANKDGAK